MLRRLYDWTLELAASRHAIWALALVAFVESSVFPIPPDVMLIPMILAVRSRAWHLAGVCTLASVVGGFAGYGIGYALFDAVGRPVLELYGYSHKFEEFRAAFNESGAWIVAFFGATPFPYKVITITSGATGLNPWVFGLASLGSRAVRFFLVAALLWYFGPPIRQFVERRLGLMTLLFFVVLIGGFVLVGFVL